MNRESEDWLYKRGFREIDSPKIGEGVTGFDHILPLALS